MALSVEDAERYGDSKRFFLESRYASLGEMTGNITHQWKQPLNAIVSIQNRIKASLTFEGGISNEKLLKLVDTSYQITRHLADTIDIFYGFLLQKYDKEEVFRVSCELEKIQRLTEYSFENSEIEFVLAIHQDPDILGNSGEFLHALLNIVLNAKEALDNSAKKKQIIEISVDSDETYCIMSISDNGGGIKCSPIHKVFDLYYTSRDEGSGLGLYIAKSIIEERFYGKISVKNHNSGARFTIKIPLNNAEKSDYPKGEFEASNTLQHIKELTKKVFELEDIEKSIQRWSKIFCDAKWGVAIENLENHTFESVNQTFAHMHGYEAHMLRGMPILFIFQPTYYSDKEHKYYEDIHKRKDGSTFFVEIEYMDIKNEFREAVYRVYHVWDVTEQRKSLEWLKISQFALDSARDAIMISNVATEGREIIYVNNATCKSLGHTKDELCTMTIADINPEFTSELSEELKKIILNNETFFIESTHKRKDGTIFPVEVVGNLVEYDGILCNIAVARDIAERKKMEDALRERERNFHSLATNIPDNLLRLDLEGRYLYFNIIEKSPIREALKEITIGKTIRECYPDGSYKRLEEAVAQVIETKKERFVDKQIVPLDDGSVEYHDIRFVPEFDENGNMISVLGLGRDMMEMYRLQDRLIAKEVELRALIEASPAFIGSFYIKPDGSITMPFISPKVTDIYGIKYEDAVRDSSLLRNAIHPDDVALVDESIIHSAQTMTPWRLQYRIIHPEKGIRWLEGNTMPSFHPEGGMIWHGYVADISEFKNTDDALKQSEFRLKESQRLTKICSREYIYAEDKIIWSEEACRIFETDASKLTLEKCFDLIHEDDRDAVRKTYQECREETTSFTITFRITTPKGDEQTHKRGRRDTL